VGSGKQVTLPVGVSGKGNDGVTTLIKQTPGSIGYVEYGYAANNGLTMASLQNKSGHFVAPTTVSGAATLASVTLPENFRAFITDPEGADDYPIATFLAAGQEDLCGCRQGGGHQGFCGLRPDLRPTGRSRTRLHLPSPPPWSRR